MKREWEKLAEEEQDRMLREAGITQQSLERIKEWVDKNDNGCGCGNCVCGADDD
jgi:oligoribonuclease (3'-5' exoribonuclease)